MTRYLKAGYVLLFAILLCTPLVIVFGVSLNARKVLFFPPQGLSLRWYAEFFTDPGWVQPIMTTLIVAALAGAIALSAALPVAYFLWRYKIRYAKALFAVGLMPFAIPAVIMGMGLLLFWANLGHIGNIETIALGHAIFLTAVPLTILSLGLESIETSQLEAAQTMGADNIRLFTTIILPIMVPFFVSSFAFVFVLSMNEFIISFLMGQYRVVTLPVKIFSSLRGGYSPAIASASVTFIVISFLVFGLIGWFGNLPKIMGAYQRND